MKSNDEFIWGVATAAHQIEGAWLEEGKGLNIWDAYSHTPGKITNGDTSAIACHHYHHLQAYHPYHQCHHQNHPLSP